MAVLPSLFFGCIDAVPIPWGRLNLEMGDAVTVQRIERSQIAPRRQRRLAEVAERGFPVLAAVGGDQLGVPAPVGRLVVLGRQGENLDRLALALDRDEVEFDEAGLVEQLRG